MDFYQILQEIMDEKGLNIPTVARRCNLTRTLCCMADGVLHRCFKEFTSTP